MTDHDDQLQFVMEDIDGKGCLGESRTKQEEDKLSSAKEENRDVKRNPNESYNEIEKKNDSTEKEGEVTRAEVVSIPIPILIPVLHDTVMTSNRSGRIIQIVTAHGLQLAEAAGDVPVVVGGLDRHSRSFGYLYEELSVTAQGEI